MRKVKIVHMKKFLFSLTTISLLLISCENRESSYKIDSFQKIDDNYKGAFKTFYKYISKLNKNDLSEEVMSEFFNENFSIIGDPNAVFSSITEITQAYNGIRNQTYPFICSPYEFNELKLAKLSYLPLTKKTVNIALLDVFLCSDKQTPSYKMSFIYHLVFDESKGKWLMNTLTEVHPENYPFHWKQIEVQETHKYLNEKKLTDIAPLLASSLMKGKKEIE